jgi:hypothetical protein
MHCIGSEEVFMRSANKINLIDSMEVSDDASNKESAGSTDIVLGGNHHRRVTSTDSFNMGLQRPQSPKELDYKNEEYEAKIF